MLKAVKSIEEKVKKEKSDYESYPSGVKIRCLYKVYLEKYFLELISILVFAILAQFFMSLHLEGISVYLFIVLGIVTIVLMIKQIITIIELILLGMKVDKNK